MSDRESGPRNIIVSGATGFIGSALCEALAARRITAIVRGSRPDNLQSSVRKLRWDSQGSHEWLDAFSDADAVVNLAGASIAGRRWSPAYKEELRASRIESTAAVVEAMKKTARPGHPRALLNASAIGYYGDRGDEAVTENDPPGADFLARLCVDWEAEAMRAQKAGVRVVLLRTGVVLGSGGALAKMLPPFRLGLGGPIGSGRQWLPWIHRDDAVAIILRALDDPALSGPLNVTAPNPVTMREFARTLGRVLRCPAIFPVPASVLRLVLGEFASTLLRGQKALPVRAQAAGFAWKYPLLEQALRAILRG